MTYEEAADILDPETRIETLVEIGYYNGFNSDKAQSDAVNEACRIAADVLRNVPDTNVGDKWVSVKNKLPTLPDGDYCHVMVITCQRGDNISLPMYYERALVRGKRVERWKYHWDRIVDPDDIPEYWMPLPEPPVKGE